MSGEIEPNSYIGIYIYRIGKYMTTISDHCLFDSPKVQGACCGWIGFWLLLSFSPICRGVSRVPSTVAPQGSPCFSVESSLVFLVGVGYPFGPCGSSSCFESLRHHLWVLSLSIPLALILLPVSWQEAG